MYCRLQNQLKTNYAQAKKLLGAYTCFKDPKAYWISDVKPCVRCVLAASLQEKAKLLG